MKFKWKRDWFKWEKTLVEEFNSLMTNVVIQGLGEDCWCWKPEPSNLFMINSSYLALLNLRVGTHQDEMFKSLWKIKIPPKVLFMIWRVLYDRLPIKINVHKRHVQLQDDGITCTFCNNDDHVIFCCKVSQVIWWK